MRLTQRARGRLDSQRSGAEMGDGRSGLLPRPIAPLKWLFRGFGVGPFRGRVHVPPAAGNANRWADKEPIATGSRKGIYDGSLSRAIGCSHLST